MRVDCTHLVDRADMSFALWRDVLFHNADVPARRRLRTVSEHILETLWEQGAHPSLSGILRHCTWDWERE